MFLVNFGASLNFEVCISLDMYIRQKGIWILIDEYLVVVDILWKILTACHENWQFLSRTFRGNLPKSWRKKLRLMTFSEVDCTCWAETNYFFPKICKWCYCFEWVPNQLFSVEWHLIFTDWIRSHHTIRNVYKHLVFTQFSQIYFSWTSTNVFVQPQIYWRIFSITYLLLFGSIGFGYWFYDFQVFVLIPIQMSFICLG